jgi:CBS domain-containing protein
MSEAPLPLVDTVMSSKVFTLDADVDLADAYDALSGKPFSGAPVLKDGALVGMLSETDILRTMAAAAFDGVPVGPVSQAMQPSVVTVSLGSDLFSVADSLRVKGIRRAPVLDGDKLVGIVTVKDIDKAFLKVLQARSVIRRPPHTPGAAWE